MHRVSPRLTLQRLMTIASFLLAVFPTSFIHPCLTFTPYPFCSESLPLFCKNTPAPKLFEQGCKILCCGEMYLGVRHDPNKPRIFFMALLYENNGIVSKQQLVLCFKILHDSLSGLSFLNIHVTDNKSPLVIAGRLWSALEPSLGASLAGSQT